MNHCPSCRQPVHRLVQGKDRATKPVCATCDANRTARRRYDATDPTPLPNPKYRPIPR